MIRVRKIDRVNEGLGGGRYERASLVNVSVERGRDSDMFDRHSLVLAGISIVECSMRSSVGRRCGKPYA